MNTDWILCSDRLPELNQMVLASYEDDGKERPEGYFLTMAIREEYEDFNGQLRTYWNNDTGADISTPIAWMPLPKAYKKE